ncbi:hypothetical protein [Patulibacter defluvii]|uniref:hypothetical protein n=1 Tax=Patulibacter defluvii TaxID=3095358 RepID=UPI002A76584E|nr:hypothetical protein [Patulibacter sp. DM4]
MRELVMTIGLALLVVPLTLAIARIRLRDEVAGACALPMVWTLGWLAVAGIAVALACGPFALDGTGLRLPTLAAGFGAGLIGGLSALALVIVGRLDEHA